MKTCLIIGGSSGIGEATAKRFSSSGYDVTNLSRRPCTVAGVKNILCDVSDKEAYGQELTKYAQGVGRLDVLVYSAGFSMSAPLEYVEEADVRYLYEVNFFGFLFAVKRLLPVLRQGRGTACVVSSLGALVPIAYDAFYTSSKAAVNALIRALRLELSKKGVKALAVMPGGTATDFTFKRKVYKRQSVGDYRRDLVSATRFLQKTEQSGQSPEAVSKVVFRLCARKKQGVYTSGFINKCAALLATIVPQGLLSRAEAFF